MLHLKIKINKNSIIPTDVKKPTITRNIVPRRVKQNMSWA